MKYILLIPFALFFMFLIVISMLMGSVAFCWDFKAKSWYKGVRWLDKRTNFFYWGERILNSPV